LQQRGAATARWLLRDNALWLAAGWQLTGQPADRRMREIYLTMRLRVGAHMLTRR
jgi:hypothetical protein